MEEWKGEWQDYLTLFLTSNISHPEPSDFRKNEKECLWGGRGREEGEREPRDKQWKYKKIDVKST